MFEFDVFNRGKVSALEDQLQTYETELHQRARKFDEVIALLDEAGYGGKTAGGVAVNVNSAMRQATVWACLRIIPEIIAQLPIGVQIKEGSRWVESQEHDALETIYAPNDWQTQHDLISHLIFWSESQGNGYFYKVKNSQGKILKMLPLEETGIEIQISSDWKISYEVNSEDTGISGSYTSEEIFHLRNFGKNGYSGLSTIGNHREGIGLAIQLENHAASAYKNGLQTNKYFSTEQALKESQIKDLSEALSKYQGSVNAGKMPLFHSGAKLEASDINLVDAQYIESRRMQKQEIASIFGVPLFLLNDTEKSTTWGTGLEQLSRSFIRFSLRPRMNRLVQTFVRELIPEEDRRKTRFFFDTDEFTLGEFKERMDGYAKGIESGVLNPNECREIEGRNSRDGGDDYRIPLNTSVEGEVNEDETTG